MLNVLGHLGKATLIMIVDRKVGRYFWTLSVSRYVRNRLMFDWSDHPHTTPRQHLAQGDSLDNRSSSRKTASKITKRLLLV